MLVLFDVLAGGTPGKLALALRVEGKSGGRPTFGEALLIHAAARLVLQADDGALIAMTYVGLRHGPPEVMARLGRGEIVDPSEYYFRIVPRFTTSEPGYAWLSRIVAVGIGHRQPEGPTYFVHQTL